jgi:hypothetical protein
MLDSTTPTRLECIFILDMFSVFLRSAHDAQAHGAVFYCLDAWGGFCRPATDLQLQPARPSSTFFFFNKPVITATISKMSWRNNQGSTGANNIPLGNRRRFGNESETPEGNTPQPPPAAPEPKRGRSPTQGT